MSRFILFFFFFSQAFPLIFLLACLLIPFFLSRTLLHGFTCLAFCQIFCEIDSISWWTENISLYPTSFSSSPPLHMWPSHVFPRILPVPPPFCVTSPFKEILWISIFVCANDMFYVLRKYLWHRVRGFLFPTFPCSEAILFCRTETPP